MRSSPSPRWASVGEGGALTIIGESGIGKTAVLDEASALIADRPARMPRSCVSTVWRPRSSWPGPGWPGSSTAPWTGSSTSPRLGGRRSSAPWRSNRRTSPSSRSPSPSPPVTCSSTPPRAPRSSSSSTTCHGSTCPPGAPCRTSPAGCSSNAWRSCPPDGSGPTPTPTPARRCASTPCPTRSPARSCATPGSAARRSAASSSPPPAGCPSSSSRPPTSSTPTSAPVGRSCPTRCRSAAPVSASSTSSSNGWTPTCGRRSSSPPPSPMATWHGSSRRSPRAASVCPSWRPPRLPASSASTATGSRSAIR